MRTRLQRFYPCHCILVSIQAEVKNNSSKTASGSTSIGVIYAEPPQALGGTHCWLKECWHWRSGARGYSGNVSGSGAFGDKVVADKMVSYGSRLNHLDCTSPFDVTTDYLCSTLRSADAFQWRPERDLKYDTILQGESRQDAQHIVTVTVLVFLVS